MAAVETGSKRDLYFPINLGLFSAWALAEFLIVRYRVSNPSSANYHPMTIALLVAVVLWTAISYRRAVQVRRGWLLSAPWVAMIGMYLFAWAAATGEGYFQGGAPLWPTLLWIPGALMMLGWPLAAFAIGLDGRRR